MSEQAEIRARYNLLALDYSPNAKSCGYQIPFRMAKTLSQHHIWPGNFLDCGSGTGLLGGAIRKIWPDSYITGIDFAEDMLSQSMADECADKIILFNLMDSPWPVEDDSFDLVGAASIINYASDPHAFISDMAQAVKPDGHIILSYLSGQDNAEGLTDDGSKVYLWSRAEIEDCFEQNGIELISSRDTRSYSGKGLQRQDCIIMGSKI